MPKAELSGDSQSLSLWPGAEPGAEPPGLEAAVLIKWVNPVGAALVWGLDLISLKWVE